MILVSGELTGGLRGPDTQRTKELLLRLRDKSNTVLMVEHVPKVIGLADNVVDLGPGARADGGEVVFEGSIDGSR